MPEKKPKNLAEQSNTAKKYDDQAKIKEMLPENQAKQIEEFEKMKKKLDEFKKLIIKKYPFTIALGLLPVNAFQLFEEDEALPKEVIDSKPLHLMMI
ncbi:MAG: hypothetical protein MUF61_02640, partial [archaeon]|nr:hypothetical protein [archaeon]